MAKAVDGRSAIAKAVKGQLYDELRNALTATSGRSKTSWTQQYISELLKTAKTNPNSPVGQIIAKQLMSEGIIEKLDAETDKYLARDIEFNEFRLLRTLYDKQRDVFLDQDSKKIIIGSRRIGKCWAKGTLIRKYDGSVVKVEDIEIGDKLMSPDSTPVEVISTTSGTDTMYRIKANDKNSNVEFVCNSAHILTVKRTVKHTWRDYKFNEIYDIPLNEFLTFPPTEQRNFCLFRAEIEYPEKEHKIDPYFLGLWLGDGRKSFPSITVDEKEKDLINYLETFENYSVSEDTRRPNVKYYIIKGLMNAFREEDLIDNKHIPMSYKIDSRANRLKLLAGIIDSDGYLVSNTSVEISSSDEKLKDDIVELCNSLGFKTTIRKKIAKLYGVPKKLNYTITLKGKLSEIPNVLTRKHASNSKQKPIYGFSIEKLDANKYYGFTVTGNGRVVLGDYIVSHNTELAARLLLKECLRPNRHALFISLKFENAIRQAYTLCVDLAHTLGLPIEHESKADGEITFTNGSYILFKGNSNKAEANKLLGYKYSLVVVDECQNQCNLRYLLDDVLRPTMADYEDSSLVLLGTPPRVPKTVAEDVWKNWKGWKHYSWNMLQNPYMKNTEKFINDVCEEKGLTIDAPFIQREFFGSFHYDTEAQVFKDYKIYEGDIPSDFVPTHVAIGTDYGFQDYNAIIPLAYNINTKQAYVISEKKFNKSTVTYIAEECKKTFEDVKAFCVKRNANFNLRNIAFYCDTNEQSISSEMALKYNLPVYSCFKHDKKLAISQLAEWCRTGKFKVPKDGILQDEFEQILYMRDEQDNILSDIDDELYHPDAMDALLYASRQYAYDIGVEDGSNGREIK